MAADGMSLTSRGVAYANALDALATAERDAARLRSAEAVCRLLAAQARVKSLYAGGAIVASARVGTGIGNR